MLHSLRHDSVDPPAAASAYLRHHLPVHGSPAAAAEHLEVCRGAGVGVAGALGAAGGQAQVAAWVAVHLQAAARQVAREASD